MRRRTHGVGYVGDGQILSGLWVRTVVSRGYVRKARNPADGRSYLLELTAAGRKLMGQGRPALVEAFTKLKPQLVRPADEYVELAVELRAALRRALTQSPQHRKKEGSRLRGAVRRGPGKRESWPSFPSSVS